MLAYGKTWAKEGVTVWGGMLWGLLFPFCMTALGAAVVFAGVSGRRLRQMTLGFAAGVMTAASVWSLLLPAMEQAAEPVWLSAAAGVLAGGAFLAVLDGFLSRRCGAEEPSADRLLLLAITLHNIPEGMAVGLAFALAAEGDGVAAAAALALGVGVQNLPEGAAVALPLHQGGLSRRRAFGWGVLSGAAEPVAGLAAAALSALAAPLMPWLLSFAAGAMLYVTADELLPQARSRCGTAAFLLGFVLMMVLDVALSA